METLYAKAARDSVEDISSSKRRGVLEKIFFHDLMNGLASLQARVILMERGDVGFGSWEGEGTRFWLILPG